MSFLFIDTNIYLSFYYLTNDDLAELKKLEVLVAHEDISLLLPEQVRLEFARNRETKIQEGIKKLKEQKLNLEFPRMCRDYPAYKKLTKLQGEYAQQHSALLKKLNDDINNKQLKADSVIYSLFESADKIPDSAKIIDEARHRMERGLPPGKRGSLGDAINWVSLLCHEPAADKDLYFISRDSDFTSPLDSSKFNKFLAEEWSSRTDHEVVFYKKLSVFFKEHHPEIKLDDDLEIYPLIFSLQESPNFSTTHSLIAELDQYSEFSAYEARKLVDAMLSNEQVYWIIDDEDVAAFVRKLLKQQRQSLDESVRKRLKVFGF